MSLDGADSSLVLLCARLSADVYNHKSIAIDPCLNAWIRWYEVDRDEMGMDWPLGFFARIYCNRHSKHSVVVFRGTEPHRISNLIADLKIVKNFWGVYGTAAISFYQHAISKLNSQLNTDNYMRSPILAGHSLGGYLAQVVAMKYFSMNPLTIVFNSPGVGDLSIPGHHFSVSTRGRHIYSVAVIHDPVHRYGGYQTGQLLLIPGADEGDQCLTEVETYKARLADFRLHRGSLLDRGRNALYLKHHTRDYTACLIAFHSIRTMINRLEKPGADGVEIIHR